MGNRRAPTSQVANNLCKKKKKKRSRPGMTRLVVVGCRGMHCAGPVGVAPGRSNRSSGRTDCAGSEGLLPQFL